MKKFVAIANAAAIAVAMTFSAGAIAGDAAAGKAKAASCAGCHGAAGVSNNPMWPNLAGQKAGYLAKAIKDYKSGARKDPMMSPMAAPLSDADIDNLAAYFSGL
ncbi:MAG: c-type cytochrome [Chromatiales bacterium]|nr:c-type cytochrome [Gammaproteobacteria bacterium]MCP5352664.1 c-type cytochrome [Chromatiales bacterium]